MKKMKKILAMFLAMAMVLGMSMTTFAAESSVITVNGANSATLTYLQIIKPDPTVATGWSFADAENSTTIADAYWKAFKGETIKPTDEKELELEMQKIIAQLLKYEGADLANANMPNDIKNVNVATADQIQTALNNVYTDAAASFQSTLNVTEEGLYAIKAVEAGYAYGPMAAFVTKNADGIFTSTPLTAKKVPIGGGTDTNTFDKKNSNGTSIVAIGDVVEYTIDTVVPYIPEGVTGVKFDVKDEISGAAYIKSGDVVALTYRIGKTGNFTAVAADKITMGNDGKSFTVNFLSICAQNQYANQALEIKYSAAVTDTVVTNKASTDYGTLKDDGGTDVEDPEDTEVLFTGSVTMTKKAAGDNGAKLGGATFLVYFEGGTINDEGQITGYTDGTNKCYAIFAKDTNKVIRWTEEESEATPTQATSSEAGDGLGTLVVTGLKYGVTYKFKEKTAPDGYSLNAVDVNTDWNADGKAAFVFPVKEDSESDEVYNAKVENAKTTYQAALTDDVEMTDTTLAQLPSTGGIGTTIFTVGGCAIMIIAAGLYFASRRRAAK